MEENKPFYIFPMNGNTMEILDGMDVSFCKGIVDDSAKGDYLGIPIITRAEMIENTLPLVYALGSESSISKREDILKDLQIESQLISVVHPNASIGLLVEIGKGAFVLSGAVLTSNAKIGKCVGVLPNTVIHHDSVIGDFSLIGSNVTIAGGVHIGKATYIGSGVKIKPGVKVGDNVIIGMGAVVTKDISSGKTVMGVPAKEK